MADGMVIQGRQWSESDLDGIRNLMVAHPDWGRTRISVELCRQWDWHNQQGRLKDMAARTLLLKLERAGHLRLPRRRTNPSHGFHNRPVPLVTHAQRSQAPHPRGDKGRVSLSPHPGLPAGVERMLTRQEAEAIYDAGKETVVRRLRTFPDQIGPGARRAPPGLRHPRAETGGHRAPGRSLFQRRIRLWRKILYLKSRQPLSPYRQHH